MPLLFISLCIATLLGFGGMAAAQSNFGPGEADTYGDNRLRDLKGHLTTLHAAASLTAEELQTGSCPPKSEDKLISGMNLIEEFDHDHISKRYRLNPYLPDGEYLLSEHNLELDTTNKVYILSFFMIADAALAANCLGVADRYFRKITTITHNDIDMRRAQIGIDDVRDKRRH